MAQERDACTPRFVTRVEDIVQELVDSDVVFGIAGDRLVRLDVLHPDDTLDNEAPFQIQCSPLELTAAQLITLFRHTQTLPEGQVEEELVFPTRKQLRQWIVGRGLCLLDSTAFGDD